MTYDSVYLLRWLVEPIRLLQATMFLIKIQVSSRITFLSLHNVINSFMNIPVLRELCFVMIYSKSGPSHSPERPLDNTQPRRFHQYCQPMWINLLDIGEQQISLSFLSVASLGLDDYWNHIDRVRWAVRYGVSWSITNRFYKVFFSVGTLGMPGPWAAL